MLTEKALKENSNRMIKAEKERAHDVGIRCHKGKSGS